MTLRVREEAKLLVTHIIQFIGKPNAILRVHIHCDDTSTSVGNNALD